MTRGFSRVALVLLALVSLAGCGVGYKQLPLPGSKVRLGALASDPFTLRPGQRFELRADGPGDERGAATTYPGLAGDLREGDRVLLADGAVELTVTGTGDGVLRTECVRGGSVSSGW